MKLDEIRTEIDKVDRQVIRLLCKRFKLVQDIAGIKRGAGLKISDDVREKEIIENCKSASDGSLDGEFIEKLMRLVLTKSKNIQRRGK